MMHDDELAIMSLVCVGVYIVRMDDGGITFYGRCGR